MNMFDDIIKSAVNSLVNKQDVLSESDLFALVKAIIKKESNFNPNAENITPVEHSVGLMQINIQAHNIPKSSVETPEANIQYGTNYLIKQLKRYGTLSKAISAYNAGRYVLTNYANYVIPVLGFYKLYQAKEVIAPSVKKNENGKLNKKKKN